MQYLQKTTSDINTFPTASSVVGEFISSESRITKYCPYTSGLVFWLDGIDKGPNSGNWTDLIGGHIFTNTGAISNDNHWYFNNTYQTAAVAYMRNSDTLGFLKPNCTIEVVYDSEINGYFCLFTQKTSNGIIWGTNSSGAQYISSVYTASPIFPRTAAPECITASIRTGLMYKNGVAVSTSTDTNKFGTIPSYNCIGYSDKATTWAFKGKIYSIRIYNRQLSAAEMVYNQKIDDKRFNLGLEI